MAISHNKAKAVTGDFPQSGWRKAFFSIRTRLLVWYFFLTACTALISIKVINSIYCDRMKARAEAAALRQAEQFTLLVERNRRKGIHAPTTMPALFDKLLSAYVPTRNEYIITLLNGRIYRATPEIPYSLLQPYPGLVQEWAQFSQQRQIGSRSTPEERLLYVAEPITWRGVSGVVVVVQDGTPDLQLERNALFLVIQVMLVFLTICFLLAWITAGRVLFPLRLLTTAAQSITESDMTQRLPVQGKDEIAELTATFNEMLDRLQFAFDSQKEFLKDASHELRTPITVIQGHLETLKYRPEEQLGTLDLVMDELDRMGRLVNDLLLLAKAEHPHFLDLKPEELDWLTEELYLKARSLADRDWRLESKGLSPITVDRQRLTQAVMNLVQNAVHHTQAGDIITIGSAVKGNYAYLWVRDTGPGIAPENQKRIFQRFVRATQPDGYEGYGSGLAIVQAIAQSHGGQIELDSTLGSGSTFTLVLPLIPHPELATVNSFMTT